MLNYMEHFVRSPKICNGHTVIKGTRVPLQVVLASLVEGGTIEEIIEDFPSLKAVDVRAVIAFAAAGARDDEPVPVAETV